jgi:hypothetical protein
MTEPADLKPGAFYWVKPVFDVDFTPPGFEHEEYSDAMHDAMWTHWTQNEQPARFDGLDASGNEVWFYIGCNWKADSKHPWPVCWIGEEITQ